MNKKEENKKLMYDLIKNILNEQREAEKINNKKIESLKNLIKEKYDVFNADDRYYSEYADFHLEIAHILKKLKKLMDSEKYQEYKEILWENGLIC